MAAARRPAYRCGTELDDQTREMPGPWQVVAVLAASQHGVVSRTQMRRLGLTDRQITRATATGRIHRVRRTVFAVGHPGLTSDGRASAAVLACGVRAALSYRSAGAQHGLRPSSSARIDVSVAGTGRPSHDGIVIHCHPGLQPDEVEVRNGIRMTTVARTQLDLGAILGPTALRKVVSQAEVLQTFDLAAVTTLLDRHTHHPGAAALRHVLASWVEPPRTRSPQEEAFPDLCVRLGLPRPQMNASVLGMEVDALFPDHGVAVELDSWRFHQGVLQREDDYERRARLIAAGWLAVAFTYRQQRERGGLLVLETLGPALVRGRRSPAPMR